MSNPCNSCSFQREKRFGRNLLLNLLSSIWFKPEWMGKALQPDIKEFPDCEICLGCSWFWETIQKMGIIFFLIYIYSLRNLPLAWNLASIHIKLIKNANQIFFKHLPLSVPVNEVFILHEQYLFMLCAHGHRIHSVSQETLVGYSPHSSSICFERFRHFKWAHGEFHSGCFIYMLPIRRDQVFLCP